MVGWSEEGKQGWSKGRERWLDGFFYIGFSIFIVQYNYENWVWLELELGGQSDVAVDMRASLSS